MSAANPTAGIGTQDITSLVSSNGTTKIYPSDDAILSVLQARFRADLPYTRIGVQHLVVVNPYKTLGSMSEASRKEYEERCYRSTNGEGEPEPHIYELAARMYLLMRRRGEGQALLARGITGSGKSSTIRLFLNQLLRLSAHSTKEQKLAEQIKAVGTVLDSFGCAKTVMSPSATRHIRYLELGFNRSRGRISSAKVLAFALDKSRLNRLGHEERSFHVFYQLLAGATSQERDLWTIEDPAEYALLASSGCYRLPMGPWGDDAIAMGELRAAMRLLSFKPKIVSAIFALLIAILELGNVQFGEGDGALGEPATVANPAVLEHACRLLGVEREDIERVLCMRTRYVRRELYTVLLDKEGCEQQRDGLIRDLYSIVWAFIVETINHKLATSADQDEVRVAILDHPGFQTRGPSGTMSTSLSGQSPLISAYGSNSFDEFVINFSEELIHSYVQRSIFEDADVRNARIIGDGVQLPAIATMDNQACVELLRGASAEGWKKPGGLLAVVGKACSGFKSGKGEDTSRNETLLQDLQSKFAVHASFASSRGAFSINHYAGQVSYDVTRFIEKDADLMDAAFVPLLRNSREAFVSKLFVGPGVAAEKHQRDESIVVQAQVSSLPMRQPTSSTPTDDLDRGKTYPITTQVNFALSNVLASVDEARLWTLSCIRPNDSGSSNSFDKRRVKAQIRSLLLPDMSSRLSTFFVADYTKEEFCDRFVPTMQGSFDERFRQCVQAEGWVEGLDYAVGRDQVWIAWSAWRGVEDLVRIREKEVQRLMNEGGMMDEEEDAEPEGTEYTHEQDPVQGGSADDLLHQRPQEPRQQYDSPYAQGGLSTPRGIGETQNWADSSQWEAKDPEPDYSYDAKEASTTGLVTNALPANAVSVELPTSRQRRWWLRTVWLCTWMIPSFLLKAIGRMKRPDIRIAWREKFTIFWLIMLFNGVVLFYIVLFGKLLCPDFAYAWNSDEVAEHNTNSEWWVSVQGKVYDMTDFVQGDHSDVTSVQSNSQSDLEVLAGTDMTYYFPVPLTLGCPDLVTDTNLAILPANFTNVAPTASHTSGALTSYTTSALANTDWYTQTFLPKMKKYYKGPLVYKKSALAAGASDDTEQKKWGIYDGKIYDLTDYFNSITTYSTDTSYKFLDSDITDLFQDQSGQDVTKQMNEVLAGMNSTYRDQNLYCMNNVFYAGEPDFRDTPRCKVQNVMLLVFSSIMMASMGIKFLAALQLGPKKNPELQDKFVLCQVPCYTEGEESLRKTIDSLSALNYDDKRKLIFVICDGNIVGSGNDRTTPRIVLDILGVDPQLDPEPLLFKSVGEGSKALNYGKVWSGLYEFEGHVVPYMVVVKVGKPTERSKPGNRGKRDSQILLMHYLNRVHFDAPMSPLELEIYHQMRNVIGIDPAFYEFIFTVDADTTVTPESLNRLVAAASDDSSIIGVCGETKVANEDVSWWTMIQVYEYYISHHLSKAFESLFGSVTCLPGCFSLYRVRTADKGRPIIISNRVIDEYAEPNVDTLHKKNLFSLGEDRFLTTLLMKHFPTFKTKFCGDAIAHTTAPEAWKVLFSQRRRWINSTVHNLCELVILDELFGFCCFSMRFFVFLDLLSTIILPSTVVYLFIMIIETATGESPFPLISIIMLAVVYGLQAIIFLLKREFMLIGWMIVYILSYPIYGFFLPIYSFWCMDEFSWGNTRLVVGEGREKKVIINDDEKFDESMIPLRKFSDYEAEAWDNGSRHSDETGYDSKSRHTVPRSRPNQPHSRSQSPGVYQQGSYTGDYYRDTNMTQSRNGSQVNLNNNLRTQPSLSNLSHNYGGSQAGSDYGHGPMQPIYPMNTGSMYGMPPPMMMGGMGMMNPMFTGGSVHSQGFAPPMMPAAMASNRMSSFSMATTMNPFAGGPSEESNPSDETIIAALRAWLGSQDLMTVSKKTAREAIIARFPNANLASRKEFLNKAIDDILSEP